jgi:hypothetical protein
MDREMNVRVLVPLLAMLGVFVVHSLSLDFTQDDAFISYRYVKNLVNGHGLVFNPGERVEGYTNFLWIIILSIFGHLGLNVVLVSKILGIASGCVTLLLLYELSILLLDRQDKLRNQEEGTNFVADIRPEGGTPQGWVFALFPSLLLTSNSAFAYWSISGLETTFFVMVVLLSVYLYFTDERLMIISSAVSGLIRPEGVLVFAVLVLHKFLWKKDGLKQCLLFVVCFSSLLVPFLLFKVLYYGEILPNPFYAKTGLSLEYLKTGVTYLWLFLRHYGLWGALYLIPLAVYRDLRIGEKLMLLLPYIYTLYIIIVGGDVLRVHRFFLPIIPYLYVLFSLTLMRIRLMKRKRFVSPTILLSLAIVYSILTFFLPRQWIMNVRRTEIGFYRTMSEYSQILKQSFGTNFTLAVTTIGAISYLTEAKVIDMLGLTDPYIAKHPQSIPGIHPTWKEKRFNTQYLLSLDPDVIMFSTGIKPSAPAERALFLSSKFRKNYYPYYFPGRTLYVVYKRKGDYQAKDETFSDARFVNLYNEVENLVWDGDLQTCLDKLKEISEIGPKDWARVYEFMSVCYLMMGNMKEGKKHALEAVEMDDYSIMAHMILREIYFVEGDSAAWLQEKEKILLHNPEMAEFSLLTRP